MHQSLKLLLIIIALVLQTSSADEKYQIIQTIDDFSDGVKDRWALKTGSNIKLKTSQNENSVIFSLEKIDPAKGSSQGSWITLSKEIKNTVEWSEASGIIVSLAPAKACKWWISCEIIANGEKYMQVLEPYSYNDVNKIVTRVLPFTRFKSKGKATLDKNAIQRISFVITGQDNSLTLDSVDLYKQNSQEGAVSIKSNSKSNIFAAGEQAEFFFTQMTR